MTDRNDPELPPDPGSSRARAFTWGAVTGLVFASLVIATWGFVSLGLDRDVINLPGVGVLVAPLAVSAATVVVSLCAAFSLRRRYLGRVNSLWASVPCGMLTWLAFALAAGAAASVSRPESGDTDAPLALPGEVALHLAAGPFGLVIVPLAALVLVGVVLSTARPSERDRGAA